MIATTMPQTEIARLTAADIMRMSNPRIHKNLKRLYDRPQCQGIAVFKSFEDDSLTFIGVGPRTHFRFSPEDLENPACVHGNENNRRFPIGLWRKE